MKSETVFDAYFRMSDALDELLATGVHDRDPAIRSICRKMCKMMKRMSQSEREEAYLLEYVKAYDPMPY